MKHLLPVLVENPEFKHLWIDPNDPIELDEWGEVKFPSYATPMIIKTLEFDSLEELEKYQATIK